MARCAVTRSLRLVRNLVLLVLVALTVVVVAMPERVSRVPARRADGFLPPSWYRGSNDGQWYALGTDYLGRPFGPVLCKAMSGTMRIALAGTVAVVIGCVVLGAIHGSTRSRGLEA